MAEKKCLVDGCMSCSTREEDIGVTYHKYPKDKSFQAKWALATRHSLENTEHLLYVCSRHFRKNDFQSYKDSKFFLKSDAVPSIFPWSKLKMASPEKVTIDTAGKQTNDNLDNIHVDKVTTNTENTQISPTIIQPPIDEIKKENDNSNEEISLNDSKQSEGESIEAIKKFIEKQEQEILELQAEVKSVKSNDVDNTEIVKTDGVIKVKNIKKEIRDEKDAVDPNVSAEDTGDSSQDTLNDASSVMGVILSEAEVKLEKKKKPRSSTSKQNTKVNSTMSLSVGTKIEASDFSGTWHPATIVEVDYEEMEVLVQYEKYVFRKKADEWIKASSPRIRPLCAPKPAGRSGAPPVPPAAPPAAPVASPATAAAPAPDAPRAEFQLGERCLARWRDNRRFTATIHAHLGGDQYEIVFDDGAPWVCSAARLYKMRDSVNDVKVPLYEAPPPAAAAAAPYHTHLFDPSRDYLGSKSERRAMKRKINIKEIFNIGQKRKKEEAPRPRPAKRPAPARSKPRRAKEPKVEVDDEPEPPELSEEGAASEAGPEPAAHEVQVELVTINPESATLDDTNDDDDAPEGMEGADGEDAEVKQEPTTDTADEPIATETPPDLLSQMKPSVVQLEDVCRPGAAARPALPVGSPRPPVKVKVKKQKKRIRHIQEKRVKREVERVKSELEAMRSQLENLKKEVGKKTQELYQSEEPVALPESFLLPGEWCCRWAGGEPVGTVYDSEADLKDGTRVPRRSVKVEDKRLPEGWTKIMARRSFGTSAGKWDVVLLSPENRKFHTKTDMRQYLESVNDPALVPYHHALYDFGVHRKLSRRLGWDRGGAAPAGPAAAGAEAGVGALPAGTLPRTLAGVKQKKLSLKRQKKKAKIIVRKQKPSVAAAPADPPPDFPPLEDGYVYVGSLKVQILENLLRCPADGCFKNFRNNTLLKMHIKHYHRELRKSMGATPKVSDLAYARAAPPRAEGKKRRKPRPPPPPAAPAPATPPRAEPRTPRLDSPRLRDALLQKPVRRPKVLLPVRRLEDSMQEEQPSEDEAALEPPVVDPVDFESAISTHTVTRPGAERGRGAARPDEDDWLASSDPDTRSSGPRSGTPDLRAPAAAAPAAAAAAPPDPRQNMYMFTETGERIKIVRMRREEIINCHCGVREEDGLMIQCELCLCWQHALCHNIQREAEVPDKYTCSICLHPRRGRRSARHRHDQDRLYAGALPRAPPREPLRRSHELAGNLLRIQDALHALRVKYYVAVKKDHPKLYLWAKEWEADASQERLAADYVDLGMMISEIGKENLPLKVEEVNGLDALSAGASSPRAGSRAGSQPLLGGLLSSPGAASLDLPISAAELERLAKSVQESELARAPPAPQPEAAIEDGACRERLLRHIQRCQAAVDARLDSIEAQVAELESQDPSLEDDETPDYFPRTKQTIQMLLRDLDTMEELGVIT